MDAGWLQLYHQIYEHEFQEESVKFIQKYEESKIERALKEVAAAQESKPAVEVEKKKSKEKEKKRQSWRRSRRSNHTRM